ncbi:hypothetical protein OIU80_18720 [Flavobacterium sp. LS1R47]|uniref:Uncharacterized protein n=1 Tax=Flavobacterium frigoritolerans TaxID=2987686 RepID=A0A9X3CA13_9FLAO|nr:hypothetical protein [Flavobacterium frigoritolerans]MCV9934317.1 hypothetical protein [Flavobacterium frigoritolerans]
MKTLIITIALVLVSISCKSQIKDTLINNNIKKDTMEYFDTEKYKRLQPHPRRSGQGNYLDVNGDQIQVMSSNDHVTVKREKFNSPITERKVFKGKTKYLAFIGYEFYTFCVGVSKEFNANGELIKETNHDLPYKFSVESVCELIKEEYDIDLMKVPDDPDKNRLVYICSRIEKEEVYENDFRPIYEVLFFHRRRGDDIPSKRVIIDGTTGKILYERLYNSEFKEAINRLPKAKTAHKTINAKQNQNTIPLVNNNNDNNDGGNNNLLLVIVLAAFLLIMGALIYFENKRNVTFNQVGYDIN